MRRATARVEALIWRRRRRERRGRAVRHGRGRPRRGVRRLCPPPMKGAVPRPRLAPPTPRAPRRFCPFANRGGSRRSVGVWWRKRRAGRVREERVPLVRVLGTVVCEMHSQREGAASEAQRGRARTARQHSVGQMRSKHGVCKGCGATHR
eukprot:364366-Chlamydomonas_euryale.AAC.3